MTTSRGTMLVQMIDLGVGMGAGDDREVRIDGARLLHHLAAFEGVGDRYEQAARRAEIGGDEHLRVGGIAADGLDAAALKLLDRVVIVLDDEDRDALVLPSTLLDDAANAAMADQHDVVDAVASSGSARGRVLRLRAQA